MQDDSVTSTKNDDDLEMFNRKWSCGYCTYENWNSSLKCTMCQQPRTGAPTAIDITIAKAAAAAKHRMAATTSMTNDIYKLNNNNNNFRSMSPVQQQQEEQQKWSCQMCTYNNWPRSPRCTQCLTPRRRVSPVVSSRTSPVNSVADKLLPLHISSVNNHNTSQDSNNERNRTKSPVSSSITTSSSLSSSSAASSASLGAAMAAIPSCSSNIIDNNCVGAAAAGPLIDESAQKWNCRVCTYENWPRTLSCTLCGTKKNQSSYTGATSITTSSSEVEGRSMSPTMTTTTGNNFDYERRLRQLRRRMREADRSWLTACMGIVEGDMIPVEAYLNGGGDPTRKLNNPEVALLNRGSVYEAGHTLVHLAIRFHREDMLATLLSHLESSPPGVKCVPSYVAPDLGAAIRRHISTSIRQRKGSFPCYYIAEWATYSLPPEIEDLPPALQEQLYSEIMDRDAQKELEEGLIINWSQEIRVRLGSQLHALWNRSAGDCLLDSVLQSTWGVFDRDNTLRRAMADSLYEAGHIFYSRWKEWETQQALELDFTLDENQWAEDWSGLLNLASQPGASLEQLHVFCLAHVLRRPIIIYGVKYVKSWRGEILGYARFEGVYLPLLWERSNCSRSPIALGYTRGHFCSLVPPEPEISTWATPPHGGGGGGAARARPLNNEDDNDKSTFLPLTTFDQKLLPVHFLTKDEVGHEELILRQWLEVCTVVTNESEELLVARQRISKPPLLVAQMTEEWLNHYRKLAQSSQAPFCSRSTGSAGSSVGGGSVGVGVGSSGGYSGSTSGSANVSGGVGGEVGITVSNSNNNSNTNTSSGSAITTAQSNNATPPCSTTTTSAASNLSNNQEYSSDGDSEEE